MKSSCPDHGPNNLSEHWTGLIIVLDPENSSVAKTLGVKDAGRYALRVG
jgi:DNA-directed RNA polymerase subunit E"